MKYEFDPDWFANQVAERMKLGYGIFVAVFLVAMHYPPMAEAIIKGIELGGKYGATPSKPT